LTQSTVCFGTILADAAAYTEFCAFFTGFATFFAEHSAIHTTVSARTNRYTSTTAVTFTTPAVALCTILAGITVTAEILIAVVAVLITIRTN